MKSSLVCFFGAIVCACATGAMFANELLLQSGLFLAATIIFFIAMVVSLSKGH